MLSCCLHDPSVLDAVAAVVRPEDMQTDAGRRLYAVLLEMSGKAPIDLVSVGTELERRGWWPDTGGAWLAEVWECQASGAGAVYYARQVRDASIALQLGALGGEMVREWQEPYRSGAEALEDYERRVLSLSVQGADASVADLKREVDAAFDRIDARSQGKGLGLPTGWHDLDEILACLQDQQLTIVAARPSVGKTAFAAQIARYLAIIQRTPVYFVSLEQSTAELTDRLLVAEAGVNGQNVRTGRLRPDELVRLREAGRILAESSSRLLIDDRPSQSVTQIAANARRMKRSHGIKAVFVDYLQRVRPPAGMRKNVNRYEEVAAVSGRLKEMARELCMPVVALAQLNREAQGRRPTLAMLREAGDVEADADTVILLHRHEAEPKGEVVLVDCIVAKQRNGPVGETTLAYRRPFVRFESYAKEQF